MTLVYSVRFVPWIPKLCSRRLCRAKTFPFHIKMELFSFAQMGSISENTIWLKIYWGAWQMSYFWGALLQKNNNQQTLLPCLPLAESISGPLMQRAGVFGQGANYWNALNAAFWHLCIWVLWITRVWRQQEWMCIIIAFQVFGIGRNGQSSNR